MPNLDPYLLRAFLSVAEIGTVNGAALALHRTQAAVSMQIRKLESLLGSDLFERSTRGLSLTADGLLLLPYARKIIGLGDEVGERLGGRTTVRQLRIGIVEDYTATALIDILNEFREASNRVSVDIVVETNRRLATMFESEDLDVAVCDTGRINRKPIHVWNEYLHWISRTDMSFGPGLPLPVVMFVESSPWRKPAMAALSAINRDWRVVSEAPTLMAMATAVRAGMGIGPMLTTTIPGNCRILDPLADMPGSARVDIGLYAHNVYREETCPLTDFILRRIEQQAGQDDQDSATLAERRS
jgi:DNA-binding transcriptional LysR family regulator